MPGLNKNRTRPKLINFRVTNTEKIAIETRIKIAGLKKSEYFIGCCLDKKLDIIGGKFGSDRLSVQLDNMNTMLRKVEDVYNHNQKIIVDYTEEIHKITKRLNELNEAVVEIQKENIENQKLILECRFFNEQILKIMREND